MSSPSHSPLDAVAGKSAVPAPGVSALLDTAWQDLSAHWGWFLGLGAALVVLGGIAAAHVVAATVASVMFIGALMLIGGVLQLIQAWRVKGWQSFALWTLSGLAYAVAGGIALYNPVVGAAVLTLVFGAFLLGSGALRLWVWSQHRAQRGWLWLSLSGFITLLVGVLIASGWPGNSAWILGMVLAIDLLFQGFSLLMLGLALRTRTP